MAFGYTRTLPTITGSHSDFPVLLTADSFPAAAIDGGVSSIDNGGGNLRAYTDDTKTTQLSLEIVTFVTGGSPSIQVWIKIPIAATGDTIFIEADDVAISQPAFSASFGRDSVWANYEAVIHASETGTNGVFVDSTGNSHDTTLTSGASLPTTTSNHPFGGAWPDFDTSQSLTLATSAQVINDSDFSMSHWINADVSSGNNGAFGNRYSGSNEWVGQQVSTKFFMTGASSEDVIDAGTYAAGQTFFILGAFDSSSLITYKDGVQAGIDNSVVNPTGITTPISRDYRIATYFDDQSSRRLNGRACEFRLIRSKLSADRVSTEYDNGSDSGAWGTSGTWADSGGGISITVDSGSYSVTGTDITLIDPVGEQRIFIDLNLGTNSKYTCESFTPSGAFNVKFDLSVTQDTSNYSLTIGSWTVFIGSGGAIFIYPDINVTANNIQYAVGLMPDDVLHTLEIDSSNTTSPSFVVKLDGVTLLPISDTTGGSVPVFGNVISGGGTGIRDFEGYIANLSLTDATTPANDRTFFFDEVTANTELSVEGNHTATYSAITTGLPMRELFTLNGAGTQWIGNNGNTLTIGLIPPETLTLDSGSYLITGTDVILIDPPLNEIIVIDAGSYSISGTNVNLITDYVEVISSGGYIYTGTDVILIDPSAPQSITIDAGAYLLTGTLIQTSIKTLINTGSYSTTGTEINFAITRGMTIDQGSYIIQGTNIDFDDTGNVWIDKPSVSSLWGNKTPVTTNWTDK